MLGGLAVIGSIHTETLGHSHGSSVFYLGHNLTHISTIFVSVSQVELQMKSGGTRKPMKHLFHLTGT